ncbi:MAG: hypothetical protein MJE77_30145 [Proteobacteria bacterium]|nr:hypothetical protein [Pseudomonadota bacterium]
MTAARDTRWSTPCRTSLGRAGLVGATAVPALFLPGRVRALVVPVIVAPSMAESRAAAPSIAGAGAVGLGFCVDTN